ncbi:VWA domain-containing protein [Nguyenibacter vanlangensis]|uniref:VWA domain-containing protein n=2 Tax=Nguyenibacter vanlangensis TaxID=1216886 RepID=A0ABZ3D4A2_9PROT
MPGPHALRLDFTAIDYAPLVPAAVLYGLAALVVLAGVAGLARRARGTLWRVAAGAVLLLWLAGPERIRDVGQSLPETALLVVDQTPSMAIGQRAAVARRAAELIQAQAARLPGLSVRMVTVRGGRHDGTRLFAALDEAAADIPPARLAGAILVTDGQDHDLPSVPPERLRPAGADGRRAVLPLHVLLTGQGEETDRRLRILQAPPYAIVGQTATLRVEVDDLGPHPAADGRADLTLTQGGEAPLHERIRTGTPQEITLPITRPGPLLVGLTASALPGEVSTANNQDVVRINGVRDRLRVLLVSGTPNQGERVWRRLLKADPSVDLVHFTILRPPDKDDGTPLSDLALIAFPVRELFQQKIGQFDLIILDGFENRAILPRTYLENIADYVRGGGGLLLIGGPEFLGPGSLQDTPVGDILPAHVPEAGGMVEQRFRPALTPAGHRHPVTADLPGAGSAPDGHDAQWGPWYRALKADTTRGTVLMDGPDHTPLLVLDRVERGRVALLLSDQIWLWSHGEGGGGPQSDLLRRVSHWLMKEPELEEEQLSAAIADGRLVVTHRTAAATGPRDVAITAPDGTTRRVALHPVATGVSEAELPAAQPGIWTADDGTHRAFAAPVSADPLEFSDLRATAALLSPQAARTGGGVSWLGADAAHPALPVLHAPAAGAVSGPGWIGFPQRDARLVTGRTARPLLPGWVVAVLAGGLLLLGWWREGR